MNIDLSAQGVSPDLEEQIKELEKETENIDIQRKAELRELASEVNDLFGEKGFSKITFVCTHNSRRSQLAELWLRAAVTYYEMDGLATYSGGTEATAFNHRMVSAVERFGFDIQKIKDSDNPRYVAKIAEQGNEDFVMFSKKYDDEYNPSKAFIAVMVCSQADADCPFVPGAFSRVSLPYEDPKASDDTAHEQDAYDKKVREIGREMLFLAQHIKDKNNG